MMGMTLLDYFPDSFEETEQSALTQLISKVQAHSFDQDEVTESTNLANKVAVGNGVPTDQFLKVFVENGLNNIVQISNDDIAYELFIASIIKKKPRLFLNNPLTILNSQESTETAMRVWQENFSGTEHKKKVLLSIQNFIGRHKTMNRLADNILIIIDELFSNAIFNAPVDKKGDRLYKHMDRNAKVSYPEGKHAKIFAVHTTNNLFVGTVDPWGSIDRDGICNSLYHAYNERTVSEGKGAGFGLRMMLDRSRSLYILSEQAKRSLVCCHMRLNISLKKIESVPKQLHINCF
jgi:hypothetical protein